MTIGKLENFKWYWFGMEAKNLKLKPGVRILDNYYEDLVLDMFCNNIKKKTILALHSRVD